MTRHRLRARPNRSGPHFPDARDAVSRAVKTVQRHFVRRRYKEHASNEASANENYSKKADGDCFK
jgi:hypothetical protein